MTKEINDPVFGTVVQYEYSDWEFEYQSVLFDSNLTITIETDDDQNTNKSIESFYSTFQWFDKNQEGLKKVIEQAIFDHYQSISEEMRNAWGEEADQKAPIIISQKDIWPLISKPSIWLHSDYCDLGISFETKWDSEHGVTIMFKDEEVIKVE